MKKTILLLCMAMASLGAFAKSADSTSNSFKKKTDDFLLLVADYPIHLVYTSSCGVVWNCVAHGNSLGEAEWRLNSLTDACDAACGTSKTLIIQ